jgi:hypothetical protein
MNMTEIEQLRAFAQEIMDYWPEGGVDGDDLQNIAEKHGLIEPTIKYKQCSENCSCYGYVSNAEFKNGIKCFVRTKLLTGEES